MSEGLKGVLLGSIIGLITSILPQIHRFNYEQKVRIQEKKEKIYLQSIGFFKRFIQEVPQPTEHKNVQHLIPKELDIELFSIVSSLELFAPEKIKNYFIDTTSELIDSRDFQQDERKAYKMMQTFNIMALEDLNFSKPRKLIKRASNYFRVKNKDRKQGD